MDSSWFCAQGVLKRAEILRGYVDGNNFLPGYLPFAAIKTKVWLMYVPIPDEAKKREVREGFSSMRRRFMRAVYEGLPVSPNNFSIPTGYRFYIWYFCTIGEREYGKNLAILATIDRSAIDIVDGKWQEVIGFL